MKTWYCDFTNATSIHKQVFGDSDRNQILEISEFALGKAHKLAVKLRKANAIEGDPPPLPQNDEALGNGFAP